MLSFIYIGDESTLFPCQRRATGLILAEQAAAPTAKDIWFDSYRDVETSPSVNYMQQVPSWDDNRSDCPLPVPS